MQSIRLQALQYCFALVMYSFALAAVSIARSADYELSHAQEPLFGLPSATGGCNLPPIKLPRQVVGTIFLSEECGLAFFAPVSGLKARDVKIDYKVTREECLSFQALYDRRAVVAERARTLAERIINREVDASAFQAERKSISDELSGIVRKFEDLGADTSLGALARFAIILDASDSLSKLQEENPGYKISYLPEVGGVLSNEKLEQLGPIAFNPSRAPTLHYYVDGDQSTISLSSPLLATEKHAYIFSLSQIINATWGKIDFDNFAMPATVALTKSGACFLEKQGQNQTLLAFLVPNMQLVATVRLRVPYRITVKSKFMIALAEQVLDGVLTANSSAISDYMVERARPDTIEIISKEHEELFTPIRRMIFQDIGEQLMHTLFPHASGLEDRSSVQVTPSVSRVGAGRRTVSIPTSQLQRSLAINRIKGALGGKDEWQFTRSYVRYRWNMAME